MVNILRAYMKIRGGKQTDYLFCDEYGRMLTENALRLAIMHYNHSRGVEKTSIHLFRHTFARKYLVDCGGNLWRMTMTRKEWFEEIVARVQNPQNKEKREKQRNNKNGYSLDWHLARARELFNQINTSDEQRMSLLENDFDVSIKAIQKILYEEGWA